MAITQVGYLEPDAPSVKLEANPGDTVDGLVPIHDLRDAPSLETAIADVETAITTLTTALAPPSTYYEGSNDVASAGTREALASSQALTKGVWVYAKETNAGLIFVGGSSVSSTAGARLVPGAALWVDASNIVNVYVDAATSADGVTYLAW